MKKFLCYAAGYGVLQLVNNEVFSWLVLLTITVVVLVKIFPTMMEGTK